MARSYAQLHQRIWADPDWRALDLGAQHLYLLLISQPQINMAGVIPLQLRKWSTCVDGWDIADVATALDRLRERRFVVVDEDTEEVLVRTLIRNDGGYKTPGMLKAILGFAVAAQSPAIRSSLAVELGRLDPLEGKKADEGRASIAAARMALGAFTGPSGPSGEPIPDGMADGIGDGIADTFVGTHPGYHPKTSTDAIGDTSVTGTGSVAGLSLVKNLGGESALHPPRCARHDELPIGEEPPCRACMRLRENWEMTQAEAKKPKPKPPWCGRCDERSRKVEVTVKGRDAMQNCKTCHPLAEEAS